MEPWKASTLENFVRYVLYKVTVEVEVSANKKRQEKVDPLRKITSLLPGRRD